MKKMCMLSLLLALGLTLMGCSEESLAPDGGDSPSDSSLVATIDNGDGTYSTVVDAGYLTATEWVYFSFDGGVEVLPTTPEDSDEWDLAFKFASIMVNGGVSGTGGMEMVPLDAADFDSITEAPADGYLTDAEPDPENPYDSGLAFDTDGGWYTYTGPPDHEFSVSNRLHVIRSTDGSYYKLKLTDFVDAAGTPGWPAFDWAGVAAP